MSILFRISGDAQHPMSEVVGIVQRVEAGDPPTLHVMKRDGTLVQVPGAEIVAMKVVPTR